jgi:hypothetical protein
MDPVKQAVAAKRLSQKTKENLHTVHRIKRDIKEKETFDFVTDHGHSMETSKYIVNIRIFLPFYHTSTRLCDVSRGGHITTTAGPVNVDILALGEGLAGVLGLDAESVGTEVITLGLEEVGGQVLRAVAVVEAESGGEGRSGDTPQSGLADDVTPAVLSVVNGLVEEVVEEQVLKVGVVAVSVGDVLEEDGADDAASAPHEGNGRLVELPVVLLGGVLDEHEALGVGDNLRSVKGLLKVVDESLLIALELGGRAAQDGAGAATLILEGTEATGEDGLTDQGNGHAEIQSVDGGPLTGTLLSSLVENLLNKGSAIGIVVVEDITGDLNQEGVENTSVPLVEDITNLLGGETETALQDIVGLGYVSYCLRHILQLQK